MVCLARLPTGEIMTGSEQMFLNMVLGAFGFFAAVLIYVDLSTADVRHSGQH